MGRRKGETQCLCNGIHGVAIGCAILCVLRYTVCAVLHCLCVLCYTVCVCCVTLCVCAVLHCHAGLVNKLDGPHTRRVCRGKSAQCCLFMAEPGSSVYDPRGVCTCMCALAVHEARSLGHSSLLHTVAST